MKKLIMEGLCKNGTDKSHKKTKHSQARGFWIITMCLPIDNIQLQTEY
jgi:hypothetical protein